MAGQEACRLQKPQARSVSRMRSTLLLRRSTNRNQRFITVHEEDRRCRSMSSSSGEESDGSVEEDYSPQEPRLSATATQEAERPTQESDTGSSSKNSERFERHEAPRQVHLKMQDTNTHNLSDDDPEEEENIVDAVLAFQRWRQHNLKRSFSHELKKVLEEARRDEVSLTSMQRELMKKDESLMRAHAESAHLRAHISAIESAVQSQSSCSYNEDARKEVRRAQERASAAEEEVQRRDMEISRLMQRIKSLEGEKGRIDANLQANITLLQYDKAGVLKENRALLDQLARKDQELNLQVEKIDKLQATIASVSEYHSQMNSEHEVAQASLESQLKQEEDAKATLQKELDSLMKRCDTLEKEKDSLTLQLEKASEKLASTTQHSSDGHAKSSEVIATGILEHLKILTGHMMKLEASFGKSTRGPGLFSSLRKIDVNLDLALKSFRSNKAGAIESGRLQQLCEIPEWPQSSTEDISAKFYCLSDQIVQTDSPEASDSTDETYCLLRDAKTQTKARNRETQMQLSSYPRKMNMFSVPVQDIVRWVAWKWKWFGAALRAKLLTKQLRYSRSSTKAQAAGGKCFSKNDYSSILGTMERELRAALPGHNIVPILLSLWRAYRRWPKPERKVLFKNVPVDRVLVMVPWWIKRVGERRRLERSFCHWYNIVAFSLNRQISQAEDLYFHPHCCFGRPMGEYLSVRRKVPKMKYQDNSSDGNAPQQGLIVRKKDFEAGKVPDPRSDLAKPERRQAVINSSSGYSGSTFTARALRTLQVSLQQEFQDLQQLLSKEMEALQNQVAVSHLDSEKSTQRRRMTFLWEVCNNLANALMDAHKQLVSLDRELNLRVNNYLELSANNEAKPSQNSPRMMRPRPRSPTKALRHIDEMLRAPDDYSSTGGRSERKSRPIQNFVSLSTRRPHSSFRKKSCIASQCAAILQSEYRKYAQQVDKGTMVQEDISFSPRFNIRRPPWTR